MKSYKNLKISSKLLIGFVIIALLSGVVGIVAIINTRGILSGGTKLYEENLIPLKPAAEIEIDFLKVRVNLRDMALSKTEKVKSENSNNIDNLYKDMQVNVQSYSKGVSSPDEISNLNAMTGAIAKYDVLKDKVRNLINSNNIDGAMLLINGEGAVLTADLDKSITKAFQMNIDQAASLEKLNKTTGNKAILTITVVIILAIVLAIILGLIISGIIVKPIKKLVNYADRLSLGDVDVEIVSETKDEIGILMMAFKKMVENIKEQVNAVENIASGNLSVEFKAKSEKDVLGKNIVGMVKTIKELLSETNRLIKATQDGKLETRGNATLFNGGWGKLVVGINEMIDAFVRPINVTSDYVDKISKGNIPSKITDNYNGDFNIIKNNLNLCIDSINLLVSDSDNLVGAALDGKLSVRADASKHSGDYKKIIEGVNNTLDAVIAPVKEAAAVLTEMSNGNLKVYVKGDYKGDHADIKNALNDTIDSLSSYVTEISEVLDQMSNSNLELSINNEYKGDFAQIKDALNLIIQSFNDIFTEINNAADQVSAGSNQVSDGSQALSQGTTEQASSIEELTASITQVAAQTKQNAVSASQANELALNAKEGAILGNSHMKEMLKSMEDINASSSNISKIIKVIDDIAFQTNMLALNAAVEAARAGQHGKGFAVVAEEVRNLAARSTNAAKETADLIEGSIKKVEYGTKIANNTADSLNEIVKGVSNAATLVGEIAAASNEQATAIYQINKGIEQVSDVVQTNSATAEQSAAASEELSSQAIMLKNMVGEFNLKGGKKISHTQVPVISQKEIKQLKNKSLAQGEAAATKIKPKISLSNNDFGKY
ncbi:MCP four helix bundle domain-containing protein [Clostridium estertheticum]|uniref:methyl-accepting chemotaxis protein n=1 Tax=Clostridium estertheticum TaxID=238834 RepID=UPI001C6E8FB2|nr:methyl-accepting chemotaxis protein [Clostridium estertheticum]MBW9172618.1 MCP four helix bundle domain-containing protein [Clostridium estertheticum]WLC73637.1 MCP four helix bundle domain-containing protein [Clostridium estertheticum]